MLTSTPGDRLEFVHPLIATSLYQSMPPATRTGMHGVAAVETENAGLGLLTASRHLLETLPDGDGEIVGKLRRAAREHLAIGAPEAAQRCLRRAISEPPADEDRAGVLYELGCSALLTDPATTVNQLRLALADPYGLGPELRVDAVFRLAQALAHSNRLGEAAALCVEEAARTRPGPGRLRLEVAHFMFAAFQFEDEDGPGRSRRLAEFDRMLGTIGLAFADTGMAGEPTPDEALFERDGLAHAVAVLRCWDLTLRGADREEAIALAESALPDGRAAPQPRLDQHHLGFRAARDPRHQLPLRRPGRPGGGVVHGGGPRVRSRRVERWSPRLRLPADRHAPVPLRCPGGGGGLPAPGAAHRRTDRPGRPAALGRGRGAGGDPGRARPARRGPGARARARLRPAVPDGDGAARRPHAVRPPAAGPRRRARRGRDPDRRRRGLDARGWRNTVWAPWLGHLARAVAPDQPDRARDLAEEAVRRARESGTDSAVGSALRLCAAVHDRPRAAELLAEAVRHLERSPARYEHAIALVDLGEALGTAPAAHTALARGLELATRCDADGLAARAGSSCGRRVRRAEAVTTASG